MKKHITVLILIALISSSILGGSALALTNSEAAPKIPVEASSESEAAVSDDDVIQIKSEKAATEEKEPVTLENLSPEARGKIHDDLGETTFYDKLRNADEDEVFDISVILNSEERWVYKSTYAVDEYDWESFYCKDYFSFISSAPTIYEIENYGWEYGFNKDMLIYYAEQAKTLLDEYDFLKAGRFSVNWELGEICYLKLNKSQILTLLENENVEEILNSELAGCDC